MDPKLKAAAYGIPIISLVVAGLFAVGYAVSYLLDLPFSLGFSLLVRGMGVAVLLVGLTIMAWVFVKRGVAGVFVSTYVTLLKLARRIPMEAPSDRVEPLVITGPYRYVRHPLYFGVVVMVLGWGLLTAYSFILVSTLVVFVWFAAVIARFEEKELCALFGNQYVDYARKVPMMIPFIKLRKRNEPA